MPAKRRTQYSRANLFWHGTQLHDPTLGRTFTGGGTQGDPGPQGPPGADGAGVPLGAIILWSGTIASIPDTWALCDGTANALVTLRLSFDSPRLAFDA